MKSFFMILIAIVIIFFCEESNSIACAQRTVTLEDCIYQALLNSNAIKIQHDTQLINENNLASSLNSIRPSFSVSFSPSYNKSISGVTQPNGAVKNMFVQNVSGMLSFSTNIPISLTGGNILITQSANYYKYMNGKASFDNFGVNIYNISYTQPLSFFRRDKYMKQTAISNYKIKLLKKYSAILEIKKDVINCYFDFLAAQQNRQLTDTILNRYDDIETQYDLLYKSGKCLLIDLENIKLEIRELQISREKYLNISKHKLKELLNLISDDNIIEEFNSTEPSIIDTKWDKHILHLRLDSLQSHYKWLMNRATEQELAEAKNNVIDLPTISFGIGNNTSFETFSQFKTNLKPSYNVSISYTCNLTNISEKKRKLHSALLNKEIYEIEINSKEKNEKISLEEILDNINICCQVYRLLGNSYLNNLHLLDVKNELLKVQRITLFEFNEQIKHLYKVRFDILSNLKSYYLNIAQLECLLHFDTLLL